MLVSDTLILHSKLICGIDGTYNPFPNYDYTGTLKPVYPLSPKRLVPEHIGRPDYAEDGRIRRVFRDVQSTL